MTPDLAGALDAWDIQERGMAQGLKSVDIEWCKEYIGLLKANAGSAEEQEAEEEEAAPPPPVSEPVKKVAAKTTVAPKKAPEPVAAPPPGFDL
jgi:hypothetical protein